MNPKNLIHYYVGDRLVQEKNLSADAQRFLYINPIGKVFRRLLRRRWLCRLSAWYNNSRFSIGLIKAFIKEYAIDMTDFEKPVNTYTSFNDFFVRTLKPNARPIDLNPTAITSPADGKVYVIPDITSNSTFFIKHNPFNIEKFLQSKELAQKFEHGQLFIIRLAPYDYHRFHFPVTAKPTAPKIINGLFESVNPIAFKNGVQPLLENERQLVLLETDNFGTIAMVAVGAMLTGKIVHTFTPTINVNKGDEAGYFEFGGSTVVLLLQRGMAKPKQIFIEHSLQGYETAIKMGESLTE
jgi:phosphatidylserine decarboxylase